MIRVISWEYSLILRTLFQNQIVVKLEFFTLGEQPLKRGLRFISQRGFYKN